MELTSRLPDTGTSIFTVMSKMALEHQAINLAQGFPDFPISPTLVELVHEAMKAGHNQYAPMPGLPALQEEIAQVVERTYGRRTNGSSEVTITAGGTGALYSVITALVHPGDEVIMFDPSYDSYDPSIRLNGGVPVHIHLQVPKFKIDWDEVKQRITPRTRMIMINTPHNPTGAVLEAADLAELEKLVQQHGLYVLSDEVYERLIYDHLQHQSVLKYPGLAAHAIAVFSFGKTFHGTGLKVGYAVANEALTKEIRKAHQFINFAVNTPVQHAFAQFLQNQENYIHLGTFYQEKRNYFLELIKGSSFEPLPCHGSYFQLVSYRNISMRPDMEMAEWLTREHKLASIPVSVFYQDKSDHRLLRFCFAKQNNTLERACEIMRKF